MYILGINAYHADASAALLKDGRLVAAIEEERFRRVKHWAGFPSLAVAFCLQEAGITWEQIDHIAIGRDPSAKWKQKVLFALRHPGVGVSALRKRLANQRQVMSLEQEFHRLWPEADPAVIRARIHHIEHHQAHLASAFYASPYKDAALLSVDGSGDFTTTMFGIGHEGTIQVYDTIDFPHSIGIFYSAMTQYLGFPHYGDEYKVMGLAPYGQPKYLDDLEKIVRLSDDGRFSLDLSYFTVTQSNVISYGEDHVPAVNRLFSQKVEAVFGPSRTKDQPLTQHHKDIAASVQRYTERILFHLMEGLHRHTGMKSLCLAGGVAQNSVANGKITRNTPFQRVYIPSAGHDAGISMGAAMYVHHQVLRQDRLEPIWSAYTGSHFTSAEISSMLDKEGVGFARSSGDELFARVAECLDNGGVVGWFSGRAEFGPRALGGRSILADPRRADAKDLLNHKVKRRESFRPFAPSILKEYVPDYFEVTDEVPFMEKVFPIRQEKQAVIPAVTHVDGTGRLQTVDRNIHPRYYQLIEAFRRRTGIPILLNTSFNENEPIVNHPLEALDCFRRTRMDMLVLEDLIITRDDLGR